MKQITAVPQIPARARDAHKGDFGRVLIVAGHRTMTGAAVLAAQSAIRSGAGLVQVAVPEEILNAVQSHLVEATFLPLPGQGAGKLILQAEKDSVVLGPGMGQDSAMVTTIRDLALQLDGPLLLDADGLNAFAGQADSLAARKSSTILTPHPGEMSRLLGTTTKEVQQDREGHAARLAQQTRAIVVLKGKATIVTDGESCFVNETGNPGMATAGAGDVLAGMIGAFLARPLPPLDAAILGVNLHGLAGDLAAVAVGEEPLIASSILQMFPLAFSKHQSQQG